MILWFIIALMAAGSLVFLAWPLFSNAAPADAAFDELDYLAAQIDDVERERAIGALAPEDAETARLEAKRRLLAASRAEKKLRTSDAPAIAANLRQVALMGVGAIPLAAIALYLGIGSSDRITLASQGQQSADMANAQQEPPGELVANLEKRLKDEPNDIDGWVNLAEGYARLGRYDEAAKAFGQAVALSPNDAFLHAARGEAITLANKSEITPEAKSEFDRALKLDKTEPRARFYSAEYAYQEGDKESALRQLASLVNDASDQAQWLPTVQHELVTIAMELGKSLTDAGVTPAAQQRLKRMMQQAIAGTQATASNGERSEAPASTDIAALEAAVKSGQADYSEWLRLAQAYAAQGDRTKAVDVLARAEKRYADAPFVLQEIKAAQARLAGGAAVRGPTENDIAAARSMTEEQRTQMIKAMVAKLAVRLEKNPEDFEGWTMLGRSYRVLGDLDASATAFAHAARLKPDEVSAQLSYAQALVAQGAAAHKNIDPNTEDALKRVVRLDASQPFALYYLGLAAKQKNDTAAARRYWTQLVSVLPAGSDDAKDVQQELDALGD
ncbi:MAG: c-type cytochrome biogenesis protein CcmI [Alphaproteobacteria bacterium]|nr:c-type cytochrome biogenesis protein CcmI [Alphaproteobacteria bacterium]